LTVVPKLCATSTQAALRLALLYPTAKDIKHKISNQRGATLVEYALLLSVLGVALISSLSQLGNNVELTLASASDAFRGPGVALAQSGPNTSSQSPNNPPGSSLGGGSGGHGPNAQGGQTNGTITPVVQGLP